MRGLVVTTRLREREREGGREGELLRAVRSTRVRNNERERMTARDTMTRKRE